MRQSGSRFHQVLKPPIDPSSTEHSPFGHAYGDNKETRQDEARKRFHDYEGNENVLAVEAPVEVKLAHCAYRSVLARVPLVYGMEQRKVNESSSRQSQSRAMNEEEELE